MAVPLCLSRRELLAAVAGIAALAPLTGCTLSDPTIESPSAPARPAGGSASPTATATNTGATTPAAPRPAPTRDPVFTRAAAAEQGLAVLAAAIRDRKGVPADERTFLRLVERAHTDHARALAGTDPASRPTADHEVPPTTISIRGLSLAKARKKLAAAEAKLSAGHRRRSVDASGATALLWGSLAVAAETYAAGAADDPPSTVDLARHRPVSKVSDVRAVQELVRQQHALVYGYQLALGRLPVVSRQHRQALAGLEDHRQQRDDLIAWLSRRSHEVPAAAAAYVPSVVPTNTRTATRLIRRMETALLPYCGIWLAAAGSDSERERALKALRTTARTAADWGAGVRAWPVSRRSRARPGGPPPTRRPSGLSSAGL